MADSSYSGTVPTGGALTITIRAMSRQTWVMQQVSVAMDTTGVASAGSAVCVLKKNGVLVSPLVATADAASGDPPVVIRGSDKMTVEWTGAPVGARCSVFIVYEPEPDRR